ncbi:hypothetical protein [Streptomyces sp. JJ36]|uniref:hypothetical protein n=1 Tax=Streptomyces sp. JJ36 TaxID=2736645 RepID=UPI001F2EB382|nr:hypothetical protein [Streptomyces sp. JJ36]MCF6525591.1 hypothetical protein [Streptomyces sp. JJ36]
MPRPAPAQLAYGGLAVVASTLALLLVSGARSGPGVLVVATVALALGVAVALAVPAARPAPARRTARGSAAAPRAARSGTARSAGRQVPQTSLHR